MLQPRMHYVLLITGVERFDCSKGSALGPDTMRSQKPRAAP